MVIAVVASRNDRKAADRAIRAARPAVTRTLSGGRLVVFRSDARRDLWLFGHMGVAPLRGAVAGVPRIAGRSCARVVFYAGHGLCLDVSGTGMSVTFLDANLRRVHEIHMPGLPSRARISPSGRWGGITAFLVGHGYGAPGTFSTAATILDLRTGKAVADIEKDVKVTVDGAPFHPRDQNYWGITFASDEDTYYATAASNGRTWLLKGSISAGTAHAVHDNVECPSLSPDGTRIAYKKAIAPNSSAWRFTALTLATGAETPLAETRSIDDQIAWLDNDHVLYADRDHKTWVMPADGTGTPTLWLDTAESATVSG